MVAEREDELQLKIAVSMLRCATAEIVRAMHLNNISLSEFMVIPTPILAQKTGLRRPDLISGEKRREAVCRAEKEIKFITAHNITPYFILDDNYPARLREMPDAPVMLYKLGDADLDAEAMAAIVGTRNPSDYGKEFCSHLVRGLKEETRGVSIVSGLAYGVDAAAHKAALKEGLPTIGVVAHGLDTIYPAAHRSLAKDIIAKGGAIVTEYPSGTRSLRANFLARNRIIAGLCDVTAVIESAVRGGALSTAASAFAYNREVMALPGRVTDPLSEGCLSLIKSNRASLLSSARDMIKVANWDLIPGIDAKQPPLPLFNIPEGKSSEIITLLKNEQTPLTPDEIHAQLLAPLPEILAMLTELEFDGLIVRHPGNRYSVSLF